MNIHKSKLHVSHFQNLTYPIKVQVFQKHLWEQWRSQGLSVDSPTQRAKMRNEKSLRKSKKNWSQLEEKIRKVKLLPTRDCEAGQWLRPMRNKTGIISENLRMRIITKFCHSGQRRWWALLSSLFRANVWQNMI